MHLLSVLLFAVAAPQSLTGLWISEDHPEVYLFMAENAGALDVMTVTNTSCTKKIYTSFRGKTSRRGKKIVFSAKSRAVGTSSGCTVEFTLMGYGYILPSKKLKTKMVIISYTRCRAGPSKIDIDDLSGTWRLKPKGKDA